MSDTADRRLFKQLTPENWLNSDDTRSGIAVFRADGSTVRIADQDWASRFLEEGLSVVVPLEIRNLFEVARGTLCYERRIPASARSLLAPSRSRGSPSGHRTRQA